MDAAEALRAAGFVVEASPRPSDDADFPTLRLSIGTPTVRARARRSFPGGVEAAIAWHEVRAQRSVTEAATLAVTGPGLTGAGLARPGWWAYVLSFFATFPRWSLVVVVPAVVLGGWVVLLPGLLLLFALDRLAVWRAGGVRAGAVGRYATWTTGAAPLDPAVVEAVSRAGLFAAVQGEPGRVRIEVSFPAGDPRPLAQLAGEVALAIAPRAAGP